MADADPALEMDEPLRSVYAELNKERARSARLRHAVAILCKAVQESVAFRHEQRDATLEIVQHILLELDPKG